MCYIQTRRGEKEGVVLIVPQISTNSVKMMMQCIRNQQEQLARANVTIFEQQIRINNLTAELKSAQETAEQMLNIILKLKSPKRDGEEYAV